MAADSEVWGEQIMAAIKAQSMLEQVQDPDFWRSLNPGLSLAEDWSSNLPSTLTLESEDLEQVLQDLQKDGYFQLNAILPEAEILRIAIGIDELVQQGLPPVFAFVYDEFWRLRQRITSLLTAIFWEGYLQLPDFWAWYLPPSDGYAGWGQHRDRQTKMLCPDGMPTSLTI